MSKLLFTVCAFGLFLSSAFGQEKSPEQLREERSHIFGVEGLQTQTFARFVASGAKQRMGFYAHINPDCKPSAKASIKIFVFTRIVLPGNSMIVRCAVQPFGFFDAEPGVFDRERASPVVIFM